MLVNQRANGWKHDCIPAIVPIAKITGKGLASLALLVSLLWTCVIGQRVLVRRAEIDTAETLRAMYLLQKKTHHVPAALPLHPPRAVAHDRVG